MVGVHKLSPLFVLLAFLILYLVGLSEVKDSFTQHSGPFSLDPEVRREPFPSASITSQSLRRYGSHKILPEERMGVDNQLVLVVVGKGMELAGSVRRSRGHEALKNLVKSHAAH